MAIAGCTFSSDHIVIKSPNDRRLYRYIQLSNGLCALLVHDPEIYSEGDGAPDGAKGRHISDADEDDDEAEDSEDYEDDDEVDDDDEDEEEDEIVQDKEKKGVSQKKVSFIWFQCYVNQFIYRLL